MRYFIIGFLSIKDYDQFKAEFDSAEEMMRKYGFKQSWLNRNVDNPEQLVIVHEVEDLEKARQMYSTEEFRQCAEKAGVVGQPQILFIEELAHTPQVTHV